MAAVNEWLNGYLEAILDVGSSVRKKKKNDGKVKIAKFEEENKDERVEKLFNPTTKYFVEEVVNSFDEHDLYRTWVKVTATRNIRERSNRLENMCWRIWHLTRKKKQIACDDAQRLARRRLDREEGRNDAANDLSELSEGEKEKGDASNNGLEPHVKDDIPRIMSEMQLWSEDDNSRNLYIVLISIHGLVRGDNMELGRDSDTGGQVKYVVELARALANTKGVYRVDLLTRQIASPGEVDSSYGEPIEMLSCPSDGSDCGGAYIIRLPCGPRDKYIPKESLWPHLPEFVDGALSHIVNMARVLGEQVNDGKPTWPYVIHGHYADAGEVAAHLSGALNVPMVLTGHSLGRNKFEQLLKQGRLSREAINATYKIMRRIEAEEFGVDAAEMVVTSTRQEIEEQWGLYDGFDLKLERKLRARRRRGVSCLGRHMPRMVVIPPGMDFSYVTTQDTVEGEGDLKSLIGSNRAQSKMNLPPIWSEIMRFFTNPHKPTILALSRPDPKKNVMTLLKAFGECLALRKLANLTLILGNRDDIEEMSNSSSTVLTMVLKLIDKYDLYGQVAYPKHHKQSEVPEIYRLAAKTKGVFINPALVEPFGLTLIEAAAYGLPVVATKNGGPVDILKALNNGLLIDPHDQKAIEEALLKLVADKNLWLECRKNGLKNIHRFSWPEHCRNYLSHVEHGKNSRSTSLLEITPIAEEPISDSLRDVEDISFRFSTEGDSKMNGETDPAARQKQIIEAIMCRVSSTANSNSSYFPGRRQSLVVVAADCYDNDGNLAKAFQTIILNVMKVAQPGKIGVVLLTGLSLQETIEAFNSSQVNIEEFDAVVCNSGSEMYFPWKDLMTDADYEAHVEYAWPGENIGSTIPRLARIDDQEENDIVEYGSACSSRCFSYSLKPEAMTRKIDELRQRLRMRGLRCNLVYTHAGVRLNVIPLFASRKQALRYLSVKWGIDLSKVVVFVGEKGDTDYEELMPILLPHKELFLEAIHNGTMEGFYKLVSHFQTQSEPAYCGLASLSMVLNALAIDPGRKWKGPWRWFDESMLDCCESLENVKVKGITFGKLVCLAQCAGAKVDSFRASHCSIDDFRKYVIKCSISDDCHLISSYHRAALKQTGTGHFSPIGGYHAGTDMALVLDVARFKYPPHWIPLKILWEGMNYVDEATGRTRGFMLVSRPHREPGLLYTLSCKHESWINIAKFLMDDVPLLLKSVDVKDVHQAVSIIVSSLPSSSEQFIKWVAEIRRREDGGPSLSAEEKARLAIKEEVLKQVLETDLFKHVASFLSNSCSRESLDDEDAVPVIATSVCCPAAEILAWKPCSPAGYRCQVTCMKRLKAEDEKPITMISGTVVNGNTEQGVDVLVPSSCRKLCSSCSSPSDYMRMHPASTDVLTVLLLSLPSTTWAGITDKQLLTEIHGLVSTENLPSLLQEEVLHLRRQLHLLKRCQEGKVDQDLGAPLS